MRVLKINLYDLAIELLEEARHLGADLWRSKHICQRTELKELLQGVLDPENHLVPAIAAKMQQKRTST